MRSAALLAITMAIAGSAGAQLSSCNDASLPPSLSATVNGTSPVILTLQYGAVGTNTTTTPVVSRQGNTIGVYSENHTNGIFITAPPQCITLTTAVANLAPGTYTVDWTVGYFPDVAPVDPLAFHYTTQFTVSDPIPQVPAIGDWILIALDRKSVV